MNSKLLSFAAAISLLLCVLTCFMWIRSFQISDSWYRDTRRYQPQNRRVEDSIASESGQVVLRHTVRIYAAPSDFHDDGNVELIETPVPGDLIAVQISDLVAVGTETAAIRRVGADGHISLPFLGRVRAQGRTEILLEEAISDEYEEALLTKNPQVSVFSQERHGVCTLDSGEIRLSTTMRHPAPAEVEGLLPLSSPVPESFWKSIGFKFDRISRTTATHSMSNIGVRVPYWLVCVVFCVLPAVWISRSRAQGLRITLK